MEIKNLARAAEIAEDLPKLEEARTVTPATPCGGSASCEPNTSTNDGREATGQATSTQTSSVSQQPRQRLRIPEPRQNNQRQQTA